MKITLYHGSDHIIQYPELNKGKRSNDYGRGFYCTESLDLAKEWACGKRTDGFANEYVLDTTGLKIIDLNSPEYNILNWLAVLADNRTYWQKGSISEEAKQYISDEFLVDISSYDIVRGYRADDSYFTFAQDFAAGTISVEKLTAAMYLGKLGEQVVLRTEKAFKSLTYVRSIPADATEYYARKANRDLKARQDYRELVNSMDFKNETFIIDIIREGIKNGDPRL